MGKSVIGLYLGTSAIASSYGAAGSVVVLLVWVYYSSQVVLLGAEFTKAYVQRFEAKRPPPMDHAKKDPAPEATGGKTEGELQDVRGRWRVPPYRCPTDSPSPSTPPHPPPAQTRASASAASSDPTRP